MKPLQITFLLFAASTFLLQTVRHVHLMFFGDEVWATARFDPGFKERARVQAERSTDALLTEYESVQAEVRALEEGKDLEESKKIREENAELYQKRDSLRSEIDARETRWREIRDIWIFCGAGVGLILVGGVLYLAGWNWTGISLLIPGFAELLWWSSPSFGMGGAIHEYRLLLWNKIALSVLGMALLYLGWYAANRKRA